MQQYSLIGDDALLALARKQIPLETTAGSAEQLIQSAWLAQAEHEFVRARVLLDQVLAQQPSNGQAWLLAAAVAEVVGDHTAARAACGQVLLSVSADAAMVCFATLADTEQQKRIAHQRLSLLPFPESETRLTTWRWAVQAQLARDLGHAQEAEELLRRAIATFPAVQTRAMLMDLYLEQSRYREALGLTRVAEPVPALAVRRLVAQRGMGENIRDDTLQMDHQFRAWLAQEDYRHAREMAMFYLEIDPQPKLAFLVAQKNAKLQREPEDLLLLQRAKEFQRNDKGV